MTDPITPPPELRSKWFNEAPKTDLYDYIIEQAAQWGANQELEACCEWLMTSRQVLAASALGAARRPKPPSLKEQALEIVERGEDDWQPLPEDWATLRRALEALPDD